MGLRIGLQGFLWISWPGSRCGLSICLGNGHESVGFVVSIMRLQAITFLSQAVRGMALNLDPLRLMKSYHDNNLRIFLRMREGEFYRFRF